MKDKKGTFIIIDGIDGSGKSTILDNWVLWLQKRGLKVFDLRQWCKKHKTLPSFADLKDAEIIVSCEPTYAWVGQAIREEIVRDGYDYSGISIASAFALDREILYRRIIIPAIKAGRFILQERGISTSIAYQPIQPKKVSLKNILSLEGNRLALRCAPDALIIANLPPKRALGRLKKRFDKQDDSIFENLTFEINAQKRFLSVWFRRIFEKKGSRIVYLNTQLSQKKVQRQANTMLEKIIKNFKFKN